MCWASFQVLPIVSPFRNCKQVDVGVSPEAAGGNSQCHSKGKPWYVQAHELLALIRAEHTQ